MELDPQVDDAEIRNAIAEVRLKNPEKGIYGGNGWANYAARYFNDCGRFIAGVCWTLRPANGTRCAGKQHLQGCPSQPIGFSL